MTTLRNRIEVGCGVLVLLVPLAALGAPRPPALSVRLLPAAAASTCGPTARPCYAAAVVEIRNQGPDTLVFESVEITRPPLRGSRVIEMPERLEPGARYATPTAIEVHLDAIYKARVAVRIERGGANTTGNRARREIVDAPLDAGLAAASVERCVRCAAAARTGGSGVGGAGAASASQAGATACACATSDAGRRCTDATDCQGACVFERVEVQPAPPCQETPRSHCPKTPPMGTKVGRCSDRRIPVGCVNAIPHRAEGGTAELLPVGRNEQCAD